jgi:hypothetical protein
MYIHLFSANICRFFAKYMRNKYNCAKHVLGFTQNTWHYYINIFMKNLTYESSQNS